MPLLDVENLTVLESQTTRWGQIGSEAVRLVDRVSFSIAQGQSHAIVGEIHSGTLPLTFAILGLAGVAQGRIVFQAQEITHLAERKMRPIRRQMPALFSDDFGSLPSHQAVGKILASAHANGGGRRKKAIRIREIEEAMDQAGLAPDLRSAMPNTLSQVDRQRVALARALLQHPRLLILHHFTRGLDSPSNAALLNRISDIQKEMGLSLLIMTNDIAIAHHMAPTIDIINRGSIVDSGKGDSLMAESEHEYTQRLIAASTSRHG